MADEHTVLEFRLSNIEKSLSEMKDLFLEAKLQQKDIDGMKKTQEETICAINAHDTRLRKLEAAPEKTKASKWDVISDYIFKGILGAVLITILTKVGLS